MIVQMGEHNTNHAAAEQFIARWTGKTASELSTAQSFVIELCALLGVAPPTHELDYMFERPITFSHGDGSTSAGRIDCYLRGHFVLEAKKVKAGPATKGFDDALLRARAQAEGYARALPATEGRPPFVLVVDVGNVIELYSEFSRSGATYTPFPDPRSHRIKLADLAKPEVQATLRSIWTEPDTLDPARASARVTREVAAQLAELAKSLEQSGHRADHVGAYLTRCLFSMFAEDVELLPKGSFLTLLQTHRAQPAIAQQMLRILWADMDQGGFSAALATQVLHFNGKLFKGAGTEGYSLLLNAEQLDMLIAAAKSNWREVEPAIFGTLLERALDPTERHALGAHYTPRAYVERLVLPTVIEPLREQWANAQAASIVLAQEAAELEANPVLLKDRTKASNDAVAKYEKSVRDKWAEARQVVKDFHHLLCTTRVLDPACGSGNFLYVTLEHLKRLEGEVLNQLEALGETQNALAIGVETVNLEQLRGIELNERAAALAELVLWIGYLQWHIRTNGNKAVAEPVVHNYGNIECRDAVLAWDDLEPAYDANGQLLTRWDGKTYKTHPVTSAQVPDEAAQVPQWKYLKPRKAEWPMAQFIVGNPPFIGAGPMRAALGDGYVETLRKVWADVPESADFVMYWWAHAADQLLAGRTQRFGFITTNSIRQTFNRRVIERAMLGGLVLEFAIPDHPWVDSANGAAVRIAMTVGRRDATVDASVEDSLAGRDYAKLLTVVKETPGEHGEVQVEFRQQFGEIHADLSTGANVASAVALRANGGITSRGVMLFGAGFIVTPEEAKTLGLGSVPGIEHVIRDYRNGRDLTDSPRGVKVIDAFGITAEQLRTQFPSVYQWLLERVKPERDTNRDAAIRDNWWLHGRTRGEIRLALAGLPRYIATVETAKHRTFQFLDASILPDNMLIAISSDDVHYLGVLSSSVHQVWALAQGGTLEDRPRYNKTRCFETFPFPDQDTGLTPELRSRIGHLAEQIDAHRKKVLTQPGAAKLTLTGLYNVLEALHEGRTLTAKEKIIHTQGLVGVLKELHDELDAAVLQAYRWADLSATDACTPELLNRLVALNAKRAAEEATGTVRWLRPAFQDPALRAANAASEADSLSNQELLAQTPRAPQADLAMDMPLPAASTRKTGTGKSAAPTAVSPSVTAAAGSEPQAWPAALPEQVRAVAAVLAATGTAMPLDAIEARFKGRGPWKKSLPRILETLEALGRARREGDGWRN
jgi:hypothetical protein